MRRWVLLVAALVLVVLAACSGAPATPPAATTAPPITGSPEGTLLLPAPGLDQLELQGDGRLAKVTPVAVEGQPFARALRAESLGGAGDPWSVQLGARITGPILYRDVLLVSFYLRAAPQGGETPAARTEVALELARAPWTKLVTRPVTVGADWVRVDVPCEAGGSYAAGETQLVLRLGYAPQTLEIGGLEVKNFGRYRKLADLPRTRTTYAGREPDAPWRAAAAARIEQLRKGDVEIRVVDAEGAPLVGAEVSLEMTRHAFHFGTAISGSYVASSAPEPDRERYLALIPQLFNTVVLENELKWQALAGDWGQGFSLDVARRAVRWARDQGLDVRGHVLVWPGWKNLPARLRGLEGNPERLREEVRAHVRELVTAMRGELFQWDVVNEPWDNHDLIDRLGRQELVEWFREAHAADPAAKLFINDYDILSGGPGDTNHRSTYEGYVRDLIARGAPLDGVGLQGHFGEALTAPVDVLSLLDRFAAPGPPLTITEYDIVTDDEELAGDFTRDFLTVLFSHPRVEGFLMWGFWDGRHWKNDAPLFRRDWSLKPAGRAYQDLVLGDWWTRATGRTAADGVFRTRGFLGRYRVSVRHRGQKRSGAFTLERAGASVTVRLVADREAPPTE